MEKIDLVKQHKQYYSATKIPQIAEFGSIRYVSIAGKGDPSGQEFADALQALYSIVYTVKFACKKDHQDFVVAKLEGLWSFDEERYKGLSMAETVTQVPRSEWNYRLLIRIPTIVTAEMVETAIQAVFLKKALPLVQKVELYTLDEGKVIQLLHLGSFSSEPESLLILQAFSETNRLTKNGLHHEIYLSDPRKTPSEKLRTILREPVK